MIEDSKRQEIEYYVKTISSLSSEINQLKNQLELNAKRSKDQEAQIYGLNQSLKYYESLNNSSSSVDPILEYICKVYSNIYQSEAAIIDYINQSERTKSVGDGGQKNGGKYRRSRFRRRISGQKMNLFCLRINIKSRCNT